LRAYYNENAKFAAAWLRELIKAGLIADGDVDERSIVDVRPEDLKGYDRCHFFAGIGGWDYALQLADWTGPVWTGSCPCQPFSSAGKGKGIEDERHLWPEFARLIRECKPGVVFGEQVASKAGREWFDGVSTDLEDMGYAAAAADLCAAGVGAPHIRQRLFWVADAGRGELSRDARAVCSAQAERDSQREFNGREHIDAGDGCEVLCGLGNAISPRLEGHRQSQQFDDPQRWQGQNRYRPETGSWSDFDIIRCLEPTKEPGRYVEKRRRIEPGLVPLAAGVSGRVGLLRGYGNAIVPETAAEFIQAYKETKAGANQ